MGFVVVGVVRYVKARPGAKVYFIPFGPAVCTTADIGFMGDEILAPLKKARRRGASKVDLQTRALSTAFAAPYFWTDRACKILGLLPLKWTEASRSRIERALWKAHARRQRVTHNAVQVRGVSGAVSVKGAFVAWKPLARDLKGGPLLLGSLWLGGLLDSFVRDVFVRGSATARLA